MTISFDALNLADAGFPTGSHGHSGGLEYAVQKGWVGDKASFSAWCRRSLEGSVYPLDVRAALRAWHCDPADLTAWLAVNQELASFRTSRLQREASAQVGRSFLRSTLSCYPERARSLPNPQGADDVQFPVAWGTAFRILGLSAEEMARTLIFGVLRQWTQAAIRIVPLGQKDAFAAQTEVLSTLPVIDTGREESELPLSSLAPGLELAGLGMEILDRKYFRS